MQGIKPRHVQTSEEETSMKSSRRVFLLATVASIGLWAATVTAIGATCESLTSLNLPDIAIRAAQTIPAGAYTAANGQTFPNLPTFCRVAANAAPTSQSGINFEVWMLPESTCE